jgi:PAS domain-containing protein
MPAKKSNTGKSPSKPRSGAKQKVAKNVSKMEKAPKVASKQLDVLKDSERQLKISLSAARMAIWEWDLGSNKVFWYGDVVDIYKLADLKPLDTFEGYMAIVHPDDRLWVKRLLEDCLTNDKEYSLEYRLLLSDQTIRWLAATGTVIRDAQNRPVKMTGTVQDITAKKLVEQEREDWKTRHELVSTSAGLVIYDYDIPSGDILWSGNSLEVLGYKPEELGNIDRWADRIHPEDRADAFRLLETAQINLHPYDVYYRFSHKRRRLCVSARSWFFYCRGEWKSVTDAWHDERRYRANQIRRITT